MISSYLAAFGVRIRAGLGKAAKKSPGERIAWLCHCCLSAFVQVLTSAGILSRLCSFAARSDIVSLCTELGAVVDPRNKGGRFLNRAHQTSEVTR